MSLHSVDLHHVSYHDVCDSWTILFLNDHLDPLEEERLVSIKSRLEKAIRSISFSKDGIAYSEDFTLSVEDEKLITEEQYNFPEDATFQELVEKTLNAILSFAQKESINVLLEIRLDGIEYGNSFYHYFHAASIFGQTSSADVKVYEDVDEERLYRDIDYEDETDNEHILEALSDNLSDNFDETPFECDDDGDLTEDGERLRDRFYELQDNIFTELSSGEPRDDDEECDDDEDECDDDEDECDDDECDTDDECNKRNQNMAKLNLFFQNGNGYDEARPFFYYGIIFNSEEGKIDLESVRKAFGDHFENASSFLFDLINDDDDNELDTLIPLYWDEWDDYVHIDDLDDEDQTEQCQGEGATIDWTLETDDGKTLSEGTYICQYDRLVEDPEPGSEETYTENHYLLGYGDPIKHACYVYDVPNDIDVDQIKLLKASYMGLKFNKSSGYRALFGQETVRPHLYYKGEELEEVDGSDCGTFGPVRFFLCKYNPEIKQWEVLDYLRYEDDGDEDEE